MARARDRARAEAWRAAWEEHERRQAVLDCISFSRPLRENPPLPKKTSEKRKGRPYSSDIGPHNRRLYTLINAICEAG